MQPEKTTPQRRVYLDWLRVLAILMVFIFHSGRFFDTYGWHVKNPVTYSSVQLWTMFFSVWGMPVMFVISGASLFFSASRPGKFIRDKILRLLIPLLVGVFTHAAVGVYLERLTHHQFSGSFFEFYPVYFQGWYGDGGNFAWMGLHLWYLLVLFVYSLLGLPLFYLLKGPGHKVLHWLGEIAAWPGMIYLLALPIIGLAVGLSPASTLGERSWGGWSLAGYIPFLLYGFLLSSHAGMEKRIKDGRWVSLGLAVVCTVGLAYANDHYGGARFGSLGYSIVNGLFGLSAWLWVLALFGLGMRYLTTAPAFLLYANEAVLPFYILHQTVLLSIGYYVTRWSIPDPAKFAVISLSSFAAIAVLYAYVIRRVNLLRVLFGMKPSAKPQAITSQVRLA